jgi:hypothetical protein
MEAEETKCSGPITSTMNGDEYKPEHPSRDRLFVSKHDHDVDPKPNVDPHSVSKVHVVTTNPASVNPVQMVPKTKRGRPKKVDTGEIILNPQLAPKSKKRGRPKKKAIPRTHS